MIEFFKKIIKRELAVILGETEWEERARKRKEVGNHCGDIFCLEDPCRDCPNYEHHRARYPYSHKRLG